MSDVVIPWAQPHLEEDEIQAVLATLRAGRLSMGPEVRAFEGEAAAVAGRRHAVAVANGTAALDVAMKLMGVGRGDEVLVSALSYIATVSCILWQGATPVFCDVDPATLNIDADEVSRRMTPHTRALLVADYCGSAVDYDRLVPLCERAGVALVVDGAQSLGTTHLGRPALSLGAVSTTSFHTAKAVLCGEGGMVFCDDEHLADRARRLRGQGEVPGRKYVHDTLAFNYRMTELQAAIGRVQLARLPEITARRAALAAGYDRAFAGWPGVRRVAHHAGSGPSWFGYGILVPERDRVAAALAGRGVETRSLYPVPAYRQPIPEYAPFARDRRPRAEEAAERVLNLPLFFDMDAAAQRHVVDAMAASLAEVLPEGPAEVSLAA